MKEEIRIRIRGNTSDGFRYIPCVWVKDDEGSNYLTPLDLSDRSMFCGSKKALIDMATQIIEACKKPCITEQRRIIESQMP